MDIHSVALSIYGHLIESDRSDDVGAGTPEDVAKSAYRYAEAFMKVRQERIHEYEKVSVTPLRV